MPMPPQTHSDTVAERLRLKSNELTAAERKLMAALFDNYPMAGLVSITEFARVAEVSTPSVLRLAKKIGFAGFPRFRNSFAPSFPPSSRTRSPSTTAGRRMRPTRTS
jgi:DNA-binding MurR/RpiR family transcriptional regulator